MKKGELRQDPSLNSPSDGLTVGDFACVVSFRRRS